MPIPFNKKAGDIFYPDYDARQTLTCLVKVTKGRLYTGIVGKSGNDAGNNGKIGGFAAAAGATAVALLNTHYGDFSQGLYQATEDGAVGDEVAFLTKRARVALPAKAGIGRGCALRYNNSTGNVELLGSGDSKSFVGTVFELYEAEGSDDSERRKTVTSADGKLVVVDLGI